MVSIINKMYLLYDFYEFTGIENKYEIINELTRIFNLRKQIVSNNSQSGRNLAIFGLM
jgi:hypothetical protein